MSTAKYFLATDNFSSLIWYVTLPRFFGDWCWHICRVKICYGDLDLIANFKSSHLGCWGGGKIWQIKLIRIGSAVRRPFWEKNYGTADDFKESTIHSLYWFFAFWFKCTSLNISPQTAENSLGEINSSYLICFPTLYFLLSSCDNLVTDVALKYMFRGKFHKLWMPRCSALPSQGSYFKAHT